MSKHEAKAVTTGRLERMVINHADGRTTDLGRPGTLGFRIRRRVYIFRNRQAFKKAGV